MKLDIRIYAGSKWSEHQVEIPPERPGTSAQGSLQIYLDGKQIDAQGEEISPGLYSILVGPRSYEAHVSIRPGEAGRHQRRFAVTVELRQYLIEVRDLGRGRRGSLGAETEGPQEIVAPMPGKIVKLLVSEAQEVSRDQGLLVVEAMKMQNELRAPRGGRVERIYVREGMAVETGFRLLRLV
jgi:biotin carboxyl carrier protein